LPVVDALSLEASARPPSRLFRLIRDNQQTTAAN
jgi:hypothetical protein